ncbi:hypothetical protein [Photobacterium carnosum]|uniref:hypothetical protein n=1 Tax=Photobacterium carnosum TaxID=2023717 RepID=UPI001E40FD7C|nr:hypothetical protein [Photobacterium carnosum]MCD9527517.1 hypothetical protein [Photobacterium carnosum]
MSTINYQTLMTTNNRQLQPGSQQDKQSLGVMLPTLTEQGVDMESNIIKSSDLAGVIAQFSPTAGWVCYRDEVVISADVPTRVDIIEAEYCAGDESLMIKQRYGNEYVVVRFTPQPNTSSLQAYKKQTMLVRNNLKAHAMYAHYRIWYTQLTDSVNLGRWQPIAQQFVGFSNVIEA